MRSKGFTEYLKKREEKMERKEDKTKLMKDGKDKDAYLAQAFIWPLN